MPPGETGVGARPYGSPVLSLGALGVLGANGKSGQYGDTGAGPVAGAGLLPYGGQAVVPARLGAEVKVDSFGEGPVPYIGQPFQSTGQRTGDNLGGLAAALGLDPAASKYGDGAYLGAEIPAGGKSAKFELNEFLDNRLRG
ncbi:uncharacterized protein LOC133113964 [Conger conger]|uniref:uncharacterized protein LOC133113964 n=1 Tax=Conger conger TaxID=82655 RepID=UPI002A599F12|nr:uncharacterized protein LOC133113964 [Conger conger]